mmetsp:Transcript_35617/g.82741  ORF Transcript_35617/g.82741 Transcript_35617/m.82741 type:complete len:98 (+) Transcript_35617:370-663(+)
MLLQCHGLNPQKSGRPVPVAIKGTAVCLELETVSSRFSWAWLVPALLLLALLVPGTRWACRNGWFSWRFRTKLKREDVKMHELQACNIGSAEEEEEP